MGKCLYSNTQQKVNLSILGLYLARQQEERQSGKGGKVQLPAARSKTISSRQAKTRGRAAAEQKEAQQRLTPLRGLLHLEVRRNRQTPQCTS